MWLGAEGCNQRAATEQVGVGRPSSARLRPPAQRPSGRESQGAWPLPWMVHVPHSSSEPKDNCCESAPAQPAVELSVLCSSSCQNIQKAPLVPYNTTSSLPRLADYPIVALQHDMIVAAVFRGPINVRLEEASRKQTVTNEAFKRKQRQHLTDPRYPHNTPFSLGPERLRKGPQKPETPKETSQGLWIMCGCAVTVWWWPPERHHPVALSAPIGD